MGVLRKFKVHVYFKHTFCYRQNHPVLMNIFGTLS